ncbi:MAG: hypothetical protein HDR88_06110 [Bacteroides sp.]|nr:hypothetical protein [Bacteroides sp.]MBD5356564.1 hypothetical protein [Bacteroides sp.]
MARMEVNGLDALIDDLAALAELPDSVVEGILNAEADVVVPAQRSEIENRWSGPYSMGISANSVKKGDVKKLPDGGAIYIYPQGTRKRGGKSVRNAEIAFINEYGAPARGIAARPAISTATAKSEEQAVEAGEKVYNAYLDSKNL